MRKLFGTLFSTVSFRAVLVAAFAAGALSAVMGAFFISATRVSEAGAREADPVATVKAAFRRPETVPFPANNPFSDAKRALGEALFHDTRLSANNSMSCASCHSPSHAFADPRARSTGVPGRPLGRHTPTLWNLAFAGPLFWDGRARSLEEQAAGPIEATDEMAQPLDGLVKKLETDAGLARAFAAAFPDDPAVTADNVKKALATFQRTLVSPKTAFDRWIEGDSKALSAREVAGFRVFTGKAGCSNCHSGFAFTDNAFHDIGLPGEDRGRGVILRLPEADHAFKTPSLRELGHSAPYMHDGSLTSLEDVVRHYETGIVDRPTLSADLPRGLQLSGEERANLIAFLGTLSTREEPAHPAKITPAVGVALPPAQRVATISQNDKTFSPTHVAIRPGDKLWLLNNDSRTHNIRVFEPDMDFDSGAQEPGETVELSFPAEGSFLVFCGIHPKMELRVEVK